MTFEKYARNWMDQQNLIKSTKKTVRQSLEVYCFPVIGDKEPADITEADIDEIFKSERLFNRKGDFSERVYRILDSLFHELLSDNLIERHPLIHIYSSVVFSHENIILAGVDVELTNLSPFVDVSCMWLKSKGYGEVTYNLYLHFLSSFIHPFIGKKTISLVNHNDIREIYVYFNTVNTNETWIGQIHLVMRMVFGYAEDLGLIQSNPMMNLNDPHLQPILELSKKQKNEVRAAFNQYGFRKTRLKELSKALYKALHVEEEFFNREGIRSNNITFSEVYEQLHRNTQDRILSDTTAKSSFHSMDIYMLPNIGEKPIQKISPSDIQTIMKVFAMMGNTADFYILAKLRSLYDYAVEKKYVSKNIAYQLKSANNKSAEKLILSNEEIKTFFRCCDEADSMYGCLFAIALCTGIRIREAMAVSYNNIDIELETLVVENQVKDGILVPATKTRRKRKVRLCKAALHFIDKAKQIQQSYQSEEYNNSFDLVFTTEKGSPLSYTNVNRKLDEIAVKMGRPDITAHTLRHSFMTVSVRCGENLNEIQNEVGHGFSSDVITEYLHQTEESRHESAERRQEYLEKIMEKYGHGDS